MERDMYSYFEELEFKESLARYEDMVENHVPAYFDAGELLDIAEYYESKKKYMDAGTVIDFALSLHPDDIDVLVFKARMLLEQGKVNEARKVADLIEDTQDREVRFLRADLLMEDDRMEEADQMLSQIAEEEGYDEETLIDILQDYTDVGMKQYADRWLSELAKRTDVNVPVAKKNRLNEALCDYYIEFGKPAKAVPFLRDILERHPYSVNDWSDLGRCYIEIGEYENAHEALDFALAIDGNDEEALLTKAYCYHECDALEEANQYYLRYAEVASDKAMAYLAVTKVYIDQQAYGTAMEYAMKSFESKPGLNQSERGELACYMALCHAALGHVGEGDKWLREAFKQSQDEKKTSIYAGQYYLLEARHCKREKERNQYVSRAEQQFTLALMLAMKEERLETLYTIGMTCFDMQELTFAACYFEMINREYPYEAQDTYYFLAYIYIHLQNTSAFMHYLAKMKKEIPEAYNRLGNESSLHQPDLRFNNLMREIKEKIIKENIDLNNYL